MASSSLVQTSRVALMAAVLLLATTVVSASASLGVGSAAAAVDAPLPDAFGDSDEAIGVYINELTSVPIDLSNAVRMGRPGKPTKTRPTAMRMAVKDFLKQQYIFARGVTRVDVNSKRAYTIFTDARRHAVAWVKALLKTSNTVLGLGTVIGKALAMANRIAVGHPECGGPQPTGSFRGMAAPDKKTMVRAVALTLGMSLPKGLLPVVVPLQ